MIPVILKKDRCYRILPKEIYNCFQCDYINFHVRYPDRGYYNMKCTKLKRRVDRVDDKTKLSSLAESRVISELIKQDAAIFVQFSGKEPFDLVAYKNNKMLRIEVKYTTVKTKHNSYTVALKSVRSNKTTNTIKPFDSKNCDVVAIYIVALDAVCFISSNKIDTKTTLTLAEERGPFSNFVISEQRILEG